MPWKIILELIFIIACVSTEEKHKICVEKLNWSISDGSIIVNDQPLVIKGVNYHGFESADFAPGGLDKRNLNSILDFIKDNNFTAIRVPFSMEMVEKNPDVRVICDNNPDLCEATSFRMLDVFIERAAERGLLVILSNHRNAVGGVNSPASWEDSSYSESDVIDLWRRLTTRYSTQWNVFAIDLKNDPRDVEWDITNNKTDWNKAAERMINGLSDFNGLFFVQGINWGQKFPNPFVYPIDTGYESLNKRVVYSVHSYGPDNDPSHNHVREEFRDIPNSQDAVYMDNFGFLAKQNRSVVISEWGGKARKGTQDGVWHERYIDWLKENCMTNNFYWAVNPNEGHIGGLLGTDWKTPVEHKLDLLKKLQPDPTKFEVVNGEICITKGIFPKSKCNRS